jgi:hypothetical protein
MLFALTPYSTTSHAREALSILEQLGMGFCWSLS